VDLSSAERAVMRWLREGKSNSEIAQILGKSSRTVGNQVQSIFRKTGINNRVLLARMPLA
jgi:DNA-binding CsgD family transcriptional regulator